MLTQDELVTIIIPSLNSPIINHVIDEILQQSNGENIRQIVVVGKDELNLVKEDQKVTFIDTGDPVRASVARNIGIRSAESDILIFLDSDCLPQKDWLMQHIQAHQDGHAVVGGSVTLANNTYWQLVYNLTLFHEFLETLPSSDRDYLPTLNLSVKKQVISEVGMLDEDIDRVEDIDWTTRIRRQGMQPYFWRSAIIDHVHNRRDFKAVWTDCAHSGYHMRKLRLQHQDMLQAPKLFNYPLLILLLSPLIAFFVTFRIVKRQPALFLKKYWYTLPPIYLSKIGWCWGASRSKPIK